MLAAMTGWADISLIWRHKNFATMHTGNTFWMASHFVEGNYGLAAYMLAVVASYVAGLAMFRRTYLSLKGAALKLFGPAIAATFLASDFLAWKHPASLLYGKALPVCMLSAGFGVINSVGTDMCGTLCFVLTGHLTRITNAVFDRLSYTAGRKEIAPAAMSGLLRSASVCVGFFLGALSACVTLRRRPHLNADARVGMFGLLGLAYGVLFSWQYAKTNTAFAAINGGVRLKWNQLRRFALGEGGKVNGEDDDGESCIIDQYDANCERD